MNPKPSFVTFCDEGHNYLYDRFSNQLLEIDNSFLKDLNTSISDNRLSELQIKHGILKSFDLPRMSLSSTMSDDEKITAKVSHHIHRLCFITTEECNLRCKYCVYTGSYKGTRLHNSKHVITWPIAKKAVDYFATVSDCVPTRTISFYGGESLLEFELIRKIVEYSKTLSIPFQYSISSNLVLLNQEIQDFLIENDFKITVSLDGPKEIHDLFRVSKSQQPTHSIVENNLWAIRKSSESFFIKNVSINTVIVPHKEQLDSLDKYFSTDLFNGMPIYAFHVYTLNPNENTFVDKYGYYDFLKRYNRYSEDVFINKHIRKEYDLENYRISYNHNIRSIKRIYFRNLINLDSFPNYWPNGMCILGMRSMMVSSSGQLFPCETLYDKHELSIGNIDQGINAGYISKVTNEYISQSSELCKSCWAYRLCYQCFSASFVNNSYCHDVRKHECSATKRDILNEFKLFLKIISKEPSAFDYLQEVGPDEIFFDMTDD